jgi:hypothetical protein
MKKREDVIEEFKKAMGIKDSYILTVDENYFVDKIVESHSLVKESDSLPCVMPSLEDARIAKEKFQEKKNISGWDTGYKGLGDHFQEGVNWALNWISKHNKSN